jgi:hypothetical protein
MGDRDPRRGPGGPKSTASGAEAPPEQPEQDEAALARRTARTATLDDPLTTSLLAEVARRSRTIEVSPDQIAQITQLDDVGEPDAAEPGEPPVDPHRRTGR